ncbi:hypothetical protein JQX08_20360 [Pseudomonas sp. UL073]|uniref:Lipoprotein n=1 Tax=Zestomonas insulae TaxID=2809017 RepID=A0ABS2IJE0_9GAMM|nr:hypothetical protein [Pseudomonas insulae]MBM7063077.1 hypothetical protein [Pseudomonas insulae]
MWRSLPPLLLALLLAGCQSTHDYLLEQGYPPAYADGFRDGCSSGRQANGSISAGFSKDVPRYLADRHYEGGWDDGFRQCQAMAASEERRQYEQQRNEDRDDDWQQDKSRGTSRALFGH